MFVEMWFVEKVEDGIFGFTLMAGVEKSGKIGDGETGEEVREGEREAGLKLNLVFVSTNGIVGEEALLFFIGEEIEVGEVDAGVSLAEGRGGGE